VTTVVPKTLWPSRPPSKIKEGTEIQYGLGTYLPDRFVSLWCYGLGGETMLNFPPLAIPVAYGLFGFFVRQTRRFALTLRETDVRVLFVPFLTAVCFYVLVWDSDNTVVFLAKCGSVPFLALLLSSKRSHIAENPDKSREEGS
jgi:hypothetical protein